MEPMWSDPKFNHCLQKEIDALENQEDKDPYIGSRGMKVELLLKLKEIKTFPEWKLYIFQTKDDKMVRESSPFLNGLAQKRIGMRQLAT